MIAPVLSQDEAGRLEALRQYNILDTEPEEAFDDLARLAAQVCGTPIALVSLVEAQHQWVKSKIGLDTQATSRDVSFCAHAILEPSEVMIVPDARADDRFFDNPLVQSDPNIRFYAGAPLVTPDGYAIGTLCVIDQVPRDLSPTQAEALRALGRQVIAQLELRRRVAQMQTILEEHVLTEQRLKLYMDTIQHMQIGLYIYHLEDVEDDRTLRLIATNPAASAVTGVPMTDVLNRTLDENFPALREQGIPKMYADVARTGVSIEFENIYGDSRVHRSAFAVKAFALPNSCVGVAFENIGERHQADQALRRYAAILDTTPDFVGVADTQGHAISVNRAGRSMIGLDPDMDITDQSIGDVHPAWAHEIVATQGIPTAIRDGVWSGETAILAPDGHEIAVSQVIIAHKLSSGELEFLSTIARDISERKRAEAEKVELVRALAGPRQRLNDLISNVPGIVWEAWLTPDARAERADFVSDYVTTMLGYQPEEWLRQPDFWMAIMHPDDRERVIRESEAQVAHGGGIIHFRWIAKDGRELWVEAWSSLVRDAQGTPIGSRGVALNVSARKQAEDERERLQAEVIRIQAATLAELSTPLIPINDRVMVMPLIGTIDSRRTQQVVEELLKGITTHHAQVAILDITGVPMVDTQVANGLIRAAHAVRLLGAQVVITGIRPEVAQTLVGLGADLTGINTHGTLQSGIAFAMGRG